MTVADVIARVKVVLTAAVTWLVLASTIVTIMSEEIATVLPSGAATTTGAVALKVVAVLGAAVTIIRRTIPVLPDARGLLPNTPVAPAPAPEVVEGEAGH